MPRALHVGLLPGLGLQAAAQWRHAVGDVWWHCMAVLQTTVLMIFIKLWDFSLF